MVAKTIAQQLKRAFLIAGLLAGLCSSSALLAEELNDAQVLELLNTPHGQQIPMAHERFRIDYAVDSVNLIFFRKPNTAPVVLTLPDGRKWYASRHPQEKVKWASGYEYDLVSIKEPLAGPWQVTGQVLPESRVMVMTEVAFHPEPLPPVVYIGERLKLSGKLSQDGKPVEQLDIRNVVKLEVVFQSTNKSQYDNFGHEAVKVGEFLDDGRLMDEKPRDGVFTGQITLDLLAGEYTPRYSVKTPLHERVVEGEPVLVLPQPVRPEVAISNIDRQPHILKFNADDKLRQDDIVVAGLVRYPNGEQQEINISTAQGDSLAVSIPNYTFGLFELTAELYATDVNGREFKAEMAPFEFEVQRLIDVGPSQEELAAIAAEQEQHFAELEKVAAQREVKESRILLVVAVNLAIVAVWMLFMLLSKNSHLRKKATRKKK